MRHKVLHIISGLGDGGAEGVLTRLCLNSKRFEHIVISLSNDGKYGPILREAGIRVHILEMSFARPNIFRFIGLVKLIRLEKPSLVQTWMYHADLLGGIAAKLAGIKRVFWGIRLSASEMGREKKSTILIARISAALSPWIPERIVCCANDAAMTHAKLGYARTKLVVIPNGYDLSRFRPDPISRERLRNEFRLRDNDLLLGSVGRFHPQKDHECLLKALVELSKRGVRFQCLLVGNKMNSDNRALKVLIDDLNLTDNVYLAGPRADIQEVMNGIDVHVLSSRSEGFPNVVAEAMACGTPCASTDVGDVREIIGDTGMVCGPGSPVELAQNIFQLVNEKHANEKDWFQRQNKCRTRIMERYSILNFVNEYESAWASKAAEN